MRRRSIFAKRAQEKAEKAKAPSKADLQAAYEAKFGEKPDGRMTIKTLQEALDDAGN